MLIKKYFLFVILLAITSCSSLNINQINTTNISYNSANNNSLSSYKFSELKNNTSWQLAFKQPNNITGNNLINNNHFHVTTTLIKNMGKPYNNYDIIPNAVVGEDGILYIINNKNNLIGFNLKTHKIEVKEKITALKNDKAIGLAYNNNYLYITSFKGKVISVYNSGQETFVTNLLNPIQSVPIIQNDKIFVVANNSVYALNLFSGEIVWQYQGVRSGISLNRTISPTVFQDFVITGLSNGNILFLRKENGQLLWNNNITLKKSLISNTVIASPIITKDGKYLLTGSFNNNTYMLNLLNGKPLWEKHDMGFINNPIVEANHIFFIDNNMNLNNLNTKTGNYYWTLTLPSKYKKINSLQWYGPLLVNNILMVYNIYGEIFFISPNSGEIINYYQIPLKFKDRILSNPLIVNKQIVFFSKNSNLYVLE